MYCGIRLGGMEVQARLIPTRGYDWKPGFLHRDVPRCADCYSQWLGEPAHVA